MKRPSPQAQRSGGRSIAAALLAFLLLLDSGLRAQALELVMFEEAACPWCAAWDREVGVVYAKTSEGRKAPLRRVDLHEPRPTDLQDITGLVYTPTFVLVEAGQELGRITGYPGEDHFWGLLGHLLERIEAGPKSTGS